MSDFFSTLFQRKADFDRASNGDPIRDEIFSVERLEQYATELAAEHEVSPFKKRARSLLPRLEENGRRLVSVYRILAEAIRDELTVSPAAEWLVDNFHIVEDQLREIRRDLPKGYYRELPKLENGDLAGYPRVYAIALALIAHTDSRLDTETVARFVCSYQTVTSLSIGELWAIPITLRVALVENLRRLATRIVAARNARQRADQLAEWLPELAGRQPNEFVAELDAAIRKHELLDRPFVVQLIQRLRDQDPEVWPALDWIDNRLARESMTIDQVVLLEHQRQAATQVTVGNIITSMRLLSTLDWKVFFESVSQVDPILARDPAGAYSDMDFATRDRYRHVVEKISKRTSLSELEVASRAVNLAVESKRTRPDDRRKAHVGFYLIDRGLDELESLAGYRARVRERFLRWILRHPTGVYLGSLGALVATILAFFLVYARVSGASAQWLPIIAALLLVSISDLAMSLLNLDVTLLFEPNTLPKMEFKAGVPDSARTIVVVPTIFATEANVAAVIENVEVHYLANRDPNIYFGILSNFPDALAETVPGDAEILEAAVKAINELNARYSEDGPARFHLFHRRRTWNPGEGKWIGWERKRGKLHEFNRLMRGARNTSYVVVTASSDFLSTVRYVITLDADTQLPRDAALRLIGTAWHPLNRPRLDARVKRVTEGYSILQPRVSITLTSSSRSRFARIFSGNTGLDPYTTAVSDVYQDLFGEGIYTGKGLYEVDPFEAALEGRVPNNTLLSHDLFESLHARAALVTDIELLDDYPSHYDSYAMRQHRWIRGDWQIASWILPFVRDSKNRRVRNRLPVISRWKILDNLRRSLVAPAMLVWLVAAWTVLPGSPLIWTLGALLILAFPVYAHATNALLLHPRGIPWTSHFWSVWGDVQTMTAQLALSLVVLGHQAYLQAHAVVLTLYRRLISRRKLLEWVTAAQAHHASSHDLRAFWNFMWPVELIVLAVVFAVTSLRPAAWPVSAPLLIVWALSPLIAFWVSREFPTKDQPLELDDKRLARLIARRTWKFFETFVGEEDHWLPPDNYQEDPRPFVAHRTSATDIGMLLLSTPAAHDFGYVGILELAERLELTLGTMAKLDRFRGHFLNWYDTTTLAPLNPQYISTVDSGNLAGLLLTLKQACVETGEQPLLNGRAIEGLIDTVLLMQEEVGKVGPVRQSTGAVTLNQLHSEVQACLQALSIALPETLSEWHSLIVSVTRRAILIEDIVNALAHEHREKQFDQVTQWSRSLLHQLKQRSRDLAGLAPWTAALSREVATGITACSEGLASQWEEILASLDRVPTIQELPQIGADALDKFAGLRESVRHCPGSNPIKAARGLELLINEMEQSSNVAAHLATRFANIARRCDELVEAMDFRFLFDEQRNVFVIGYDVTHARRDNSFYDLLATEARLASFIAIAKGDVPQEHWFHLGRQLTQVDGHRALISWTATIFEYLMPVLVMRSYPGSLLDQTYRAVVRRQIEYGRERGVPWGVSESGYNARDLQLNYQYGPFGIPGLGLKRGLSNDLVVSPYSTALAAMVEPTEALENMRRLAREGALTTYGFYEAIDYTKERVKPNNKSALVKAFMVHHQGMLLVALDNVVNGNVMQNRFHSDPQVLATELLLQERIPRAAPLTSPRAEELRAQGLRRASATPDPRRFDTANLPTPRTQVLSNGVYSVMVTTAGSGYSWCGPLAVTRWREDVTRDNWGSFFYLRDLRSGSVWSAGYLPVSGKPQSYDVELSEDKAEFCRSDKGIVTETEIIVSPEDNTEIRRVCVTNNTTRTRDIEVTSYQEVVLGPGAADAAHPAFSNLFVETEFVADESCLLATRRRRSQQDREVWGLHVVVAEGESVGGVQYETDRARFLGRGHTTADPIAVMEGRPLSNTVGAVLDPIFSLRQRVRLAAGATTRITFTTGVTESRDEALRIADKYHNPYAFEREAGLAWTKSQVEMRHLHIDTNEAHLFQRLAGRLLFSDPSLRPRSHVLALNTKGQSGLWPYGISGDLPIVLVRIRGESELSMVRHLLRGHEYLRLKGVVFDLVIMNDHPPSYFQDLQDEVQRLIRTSGSQALMNKPGGVFLLRSDIIPDEDRILLHAVARVVLVAERGPFEEQLVRRPVEDELPPRLIPQMPSRRFPEHPVGQQDLAFFNGLGGFAESGREYRTILAEGQWTPAPWLNVVANEKDFGFQISESGSGFTWSMNSRENRLTPWSNDPVSDSAGEAIYLRDEETGEVWSPTPLPIRESEQYLVKHGQGYTVFEHSSHGIYQELLVFVPVDAPVKISILHLRNYSERRRKLSVTSYAELVLGTERSRMAPYVITEVDEVNGAILARNPFNAEFADRVVFMDMSERERTVTCDRKEFLGRNGSLQDPAALRRVMLSGRTGAGLDPCAAMQAVIELEPGEDRELAFLLGEAETQDETRAVASAYKDLNSAKDAFRKVLDYWHNTLGAIEVKTPDSAMDIMMNRWLLYQALSCRVWSRSAFYQSSGAFGFRDQLQDCCALVYSRPEIAREHILRAASRQFKEGDVQHWWHPPTGRGARTRCSDDRVWLPFVASFYIRVTGDESVLEESASFLEAPPLEPDQDEAYQQPEVSPESATLFEHCARALDRSLTVGKHGLPLIGSGDWNDGMNRVGVGGKGESVWLGWFLISTLRAFAGFCDTRKQKRRGNRYRAHADKLNIALEENGWDGDWYRRAYFDDGTPLGSAHSEECRIDSIAQSWAVISDTAEPERAARAMSAVEEYLLRRGDALSVLFTPPFDKTALDPGYIKGYVPGVRENGGQYTHAALWTVIAYALLGDGDRAGELFSLLNPINHSSTRAGLHRYRVEPYVVAADVYAVWPHTGRGGWTWYTGSASWMYRAGLEWILGFKQRGNRLRIDPCVPRNWREYEINYKRGSTTYQLVIENPRGLNRGVAVVEIDGNRLEASEIELVDDGREHAVRITLEEKT